MNDSTAPGFLLPLDVPAPLEGQALLRFLQQWVVGVSGLSADLVRPSFQPEPPSVPTAGDAWCALQIGDRSSDTFPAVINEADEDGGLGAVKMKRQEQLDLLLSFYDLGVEGLADFYASQFRDGTAMGQNRWYLRASGFAMTWIGTLTPVPVLLASRWQYRVDLPVRVRRQIDRLYPVRTLVGAQGEVLTDGGLPPQNLPPIPPN